MSMPIARRLASGPVRIVLCAALLLAGGVAMEAAEVSPQANAHAHNDYAHQRPLWDALDQGFCSVEADVHLVDGRLLVAHDRSATRPDRDLDSLYLAPLDERVKRNGGRVHPGAAGFTLLVDIKTDAAETYAALKPLLARHAGMLTTFGPDGVRAGAVTVIVSGNRPIVEMRGETTRLAAIDGRMSDLAGSDPPSLIPLVSQQWGSLFKWRGKGPMSEPESVRLRELVQKAHAQGRRIRFWAIPDNPAGWETLRRAEVDLINTDHLAELRQFLQTGP